jgi:hypothetical protein
MTFMRTAFAALIVAACLFACHSKQQHTVNFSDHMPPDVMALANDSFEIKQLNEAFLNYTLQKFTVEKNKITVVTGKKGLKVTVNPSVLEKMDGTSFDGPVEVRMAELTNSSDLFKANAATLSNGKLLVSGGSYFIEIYSDGKPLRIKKGKHMQVDFPLLNDDEMELFYGQRNEDGNMNWQSAGKSLVPSADENMVSQAMFTDSNRYTTTDVMPSFMYDTNGNAKIYASTKEQVYYYDTKLTIANLVDTINKHSSKIFLDTVYMWPKAPANMPEGARVDSGFLYRVYGPAKQFIIKRFKDADAELAQKEKQKKKIEQSRENWQPKTLAGQLQRYYTSSSISSLGWLNCDRFYKGPQNSDVEVELPITLNKCTLHYFLIFNEFSGLLNGSVKTDSVQHIRLNNLPNNQAVILIAFVKTNNKIYQCKKEFTVSPDIRVQPLFEEVSAGQLKKIFGNNVRI